MVTKITTSGQTKERDLTPISRYDREGNKDEQKGVGNLSSMRT